MIDPFIDGLAYLGEVIYFDIFSVLARQTLPPTAVEWQRAHGPL
jgi:hypothetical protein